MGKGDRRRPGHLADYEAGYGYIDWSATGQDGPVRPPDRPGRVRPPDPHQTDTDRVRKWLRQA